MKTKTKETLKWFFAILASLIILSFGVFAIMSIEFRTKTILIEIVVFIIVSYITARKLERLPSPKNP